jgi:hypothetical protein
MPRDASLKRCNGRRNNEWRIHLAASKPKTKAGKQRKVHKVMSEHKRGTLKSGSGKKVRSRKQAVAIAMSESGQSRRKSTRRKSSSSRGKSSGARSRSSSSRSSSRKK